MLPCAPVTLTDVRRIFSPRGGLVKPRQTPAGDRRRVLVRPVSFRLPLPCHPGFRQGLMALPPFPAKLTGWCLTQPAFFRCPFCSIVSPGADSPFHPSDEQFTPLSTGWARSNTHSFPRDKLRTYLPLKRLFFHRTGTNAGRSGLGILVPR